MQKKIVAAVCAAMLALAMPAAAMAGMLNLTPAASTTPAEFALGTPNGSDNVIESGLVNGTGTLLQGSKWSLDTLEGTGNANSYALSAVTPSLATAANAKFATGIAIKNTSTTTEQAGNAAKINEEGLALTLQISNAYDGPKDLAITRITDGKGLEYYIWSQDAAIESGIIAIANTQKLTWNKGQSITVETWVGGNDMELQANIPANGNGAAADGSSTSPKTGE